MKHQYIHRPTKTVRTEILKGDPIVNTIYSSVRENAGMVFNMLVSPWMTSLIGTVSYDLPFQGAKKDPIVFWGEYGIDLTESAQDISTLNTYRKVFERQIRYWDLRPMPDRQDAVVAPADARLLIGSFSRDRALFIKDKFFEFSELLGADKTQWLNAFQDGDFTVFRLTPDKYHFNHTPVAGQVADIYEIDGCFHSCNPGAVVRAVTPYSKNRRVVTIIDTDVPGGTGVGLVAMVEVVAMMIGRIVQRYSRERYQSPVDVSPGLFVEKGCPKSLFRPGSSTTILIFQKDRVQFSRDLVENQQRTDAKSRFSRGFGCSLVETEVMVRELISTATAPGWAKTGQGKEHKTDSGEK